MGRVYDSPILPFIKLCLLNLLIAENVNGYPRHVDMATNVEQPANLMAESRITANPALARQVFKEGDSHDPEERSDDNDALKKRNRRSASARSFADMQEMLSDGKIVFPGEEISRRVPACKGSTYCEKVDSYPGNLVTKAIQRNETLKYLAGVDELSGIVERFDAMDIPLCVSVEQVIYPQTAENKDKQWKYVANQEDFKQGVRIEKCSKENANCNVIGGPGEGYRTTCKQKYIYRQLAAVLSDGTMVPDTFKFPSSCCCHVAFTGSPVTRMGLNTGEITQVTVAKSRRRK